MATCKITEYAFIASTGNPPSNMPVGQEPALTVQSVTFSTAAQSAAFNDRTKLVRVKSDAKAYVAFGDNPTADANSTELEADTPEYFGVVPGQKISVYDGTS